MNNNKEKLSQVDFVKYVLVKKGDISRNYCLKRYISRLSSIIFNLKRFGWEFKTYKRTSWFNKSKYDFVYEVTRYGL